MPKIQIISTGEIQEKPQAWINHFARKIGVEFDLVPIEEIGVKIASAEDSAEIAYSKLSEGQKDLIRSKGKRLVRIKGDWTLVDCINKAVDEIRISLPQKEIAKNGAIARANQELLLLGAFKGILRKVISNSAVANELYEDFNVVGISGDEDLENALELIGRIIFK